MSTPTILPWHLKAAEVERLKAQSVRGFTYEELEVLWDKLRTDYNKVIARVAELEQDKARLNWLEASPYRHVEGDYWDTGNPYWRCQDRKNVNTIACIGPDIRAAIDAARGKGGATCERKEGESLASQVSAMSTDNTQLRARVAELEAGFVVVGQRHTADRISYVWTTPATEIPEGTPIYVPRAALDAARGEGT